MARWKIVSGARAFYRFPEREVAIGWARDLLRGDELRTVNVCVSPEAENASDLPPEARTAIKSHGRSVINALLTEEKLPRIVDVTLEGLVFDYSEEPVEDEDIDDDDDLDDEEIDDDDDLDDDAAVGGHGAPFIAP